MKNTKIKFLFAVIFSYSLIAIHAQEEEKKSPLTLSITTDAAYYPQSDFKAGRRETHFAPITKRIRQHRVLHDLYGGISD
ncbi:hypothetical protein DYE50_09700 [Treponema ruminis]|uniref:Uncharacterized protein n=1 Tax=Treponema ruminis TaxID=744515 RepID=A0A7W8G9C5_9SPIR|nr:hypothetical protein [Treponema ruminis]MBB5226253.1 hypothetical protein [Treponema ruminis]QSI02839.1 hypothetical protein DYE50_09700 [Treponema ruminis]